MLEYVLSMLVGFWMGISGLLYLTFYWIEEKWDLPLAEGPPANASHIKLQQLVQRVIEEALKLPSLLDYSGIDRDTAGRLPEFNPKTYEDLLATAILNKVIDRYQNENKKSNGASSSGVHSGSSSPGDFSRGRRRKSSKRESSPEPSSLEPMSHDDYGHSDSSGHMSGTPARIEECTKQKNAYSTDEEDPHEKSFSNPVDGALSNINFRHNSRIQFPEYGGDIVDINESSQTNMYENKRLSNGNLSGNGEIYANNNSWEENWLFQKKKIKPQSVPVPMLVPNANTEYKPMIGDKDADDTTDLSDLGSDIEEVSSHDIKQILIDSKSIIGGKNPEIVEILLDDSFVDVIDGQDKCNISVNVTNVDINNKIDENGNDKSMPTYIENGKNDAKIEKNNLGRFLKNLESDDMDSSLNPYIKSISTLEEKLNIKNITEATNLDVIDSKDNENLESLENQQQEGEYFETIAKPVQRHMDSLKRQHNIPQRPNKIVIPQEDSEAPPPLPASPMPTRLSTTEIIVEDIDYQTPVILQDDIVKSKLKILDDIEIKTDSTALKKSDVVDKPLENSDADFSLPHLPGTIAEREHKKWLNAVPMVNNPYSPEAIKSRLDKQNQSSIFTTMNKISPRSAQEVTNEDPPTLQRVLSKDVTENVRYQRDYYINEAKRSTGARKMKPDFKFDSDNYIKSDDDLNEAGTSETEIENKKAAYTVNQAEVYSATPIIIEDTDSMTAQFDELYKKATKIESNEQDIYIMPVDLNDNQNVEKLLQLTNGTIITDSFEQSDSISSLDETPRIYNIETGRIIKKLKDDLFNSNKNNNNLENKKDYRKSTGDLYTKFNISSDALDYNAKGKEDVNIPSVKDLAKKFIKEEQTEKAPAIVKPKKINKEKLDNGSEFVPSPATEKFLKQPQHMHSLTARSISKEFREGLKLSMPVTNLHPGGTKDIPNGTERLVKGGSAESLVPEPGSLKNKLAFFEKLSRDK